MERNFEHKDSNFQNLEGDVSLEKVKGQCSGYNWEIGELLLPKKLLGGFGGYTPQEMSSGGGHRWIGWYWDATDATLWWWPLDVGCRAERLCGFLSVVYLWVLASRSLSLYPPFQKPSLLRWGAVAMVVIKSGSSPIW